MRACRRDGRSRIRCIQIRDSRSLTLSPSRRVPLHAKVPGRSPPRIGAQPPPSLARSAEPNGARHWIDHRHRHLCAHGDSRVPERRPRARAVDDHLRRRLRVRRPLLRRVRGDGPRRGQRVHLRVRDGRRNLRLDHRLGPHSRVRAQCVDGRRWLVRILREPVSGSGHRDSARAHGAPRLDRDARRWLARSRGVQSARCVRGAPRLGAARHRDQAIGWDEYGPRAHQVARPRLLRRALRVLRPSGESDPVRAA